MNESSLSQEEVLAVLTENATAADADAVWPAMSWDALCRGGVLTWSVPTAYGGRDLDAVELLEGYAQLGSACLTTAFVLSQREAAVRRLVDSGNEPLCRELLRPLACGGHFATVGLSQLTTSRQHGRPVLAARLTDAAIELNGTIPWVTGAAQANHLVIGAVIEDGQQVLAVLPADAPGVSVGPPLGLMALQGSLTSEVACDHVVLDRRWLLAGPAPQVMAGVRGGTGGLETSCLALGLTAAAVHHLQQIDAGRSDLHLTAERLEQARRACWEELIERARHGSTPEKAAALRARANALVLRATQAALTASKGTGFLKQHPAQRWARQAMFFLVWSCPRPAADATLALLVGDHYVCP